MKTPDIQTTELMIIKTFDEVEPIATEHTIAETLRILLTQHPMFDGELIDGTVECAVDAWGDTQIHPAIAYAAYVQAVANVEVMTPIPAQ